MARGRDDVAGDAAVQALLAGDDESYEEYVPLKERRRREAERRAGKLGKNRRDREREILEQERLATFLTNALQLSLKLWRSYITASCCASVLTESRLIRDAPTCRKR